MKPAQRVFNAFLAVSAAMARRPALSAVTRGLMRALARLTIRTRKLRRADTPEGIGEQWQRAFPSRKFVPIRAVRDGTVYAEIHGNCPLRGSGDTLACHRMMEYDRELARHAGGEFVVLRSQAEPGRTHCEVAMRRAGADLRDLVPAHVRAPPAP